MERSDSEEHPGRRSRLTEVEAGILSIEKRQWKYPGTKEQAIRAELDMAPIAYYQRLNQMIDDPRIIAAEPALTRRLRDFRDQ